MNGQSQKIESLRQLVNAVKEVPVENVLGQELELVPRGRYLMALCPFHPDNHLGSFVITPDRNMWKCFACGEGGNGISFVMKYHDLPFQKACFRIALEHGLITQDRYKSLSRTKYDPKILAHLQKRVMEEKKQDLPQTPKADPWVVHTAYTLMAEICGLSDSHRKHLLKERGLRPDELSDYFTFPTRKLQLSRHIIERYAKQLLEKHGVEKITELPEEDQKRCEQQFIAFQQQLPFVPGFFGSRTRGVDFTSAKGIGILVRDEKDTVRGIQIRRDKVKKGESRYVWFSSAFAHSDPNCSGGNGSGSPGGYIRCKKPNQGTPLLCLTEGRFKAEAIAKQIGDCIYVSGVSTWKSVLPMVRNTIGERHIIYLMFDADLFGNVAVHQQLTELAAELQKMQIRCNLLVWPKEKGKGFDDLLQDTGTDSFRNYMRNYPINVFQAHYENALAKVLNQLCIESTKELRKEDIDHFSSLLQETEEEELGLKEKKGDKKNEPKQTIYADSLRKDNQGTVPA